MFYPTVEGSVGSPETRVVKGPGRCTRGPDQCRFSHFPTAFLRAWP